VFISFGRCFDFLAGFAREMGKGLFSNAEHLCGHMTLNGHVLRYYIISGFIKISTPHENYSLASPQVLKLSLPVIVYNLFQLMYSYCLQINVHDVCSVGVACLRYNSV
jgi:hypothetical protein